jgi:hypothetical protein
VICVPWIAQSTTGVPWVALLPALVLLVSLALLRTSTIAWDEQNSTSTTNADDLHGSASADHLRSKVG